MLDSTHMPTFSFKSKVANPADVRPHICVGPDVLFQHARLLTANATLLANVFPPASTSDIHVLFAGLVPVDKWTQSTFNKDILNKPGMRAAEPFR